MAAQDSDRVQFDRRSARRIAAAVHTVERTPQNRRGPDFAPLVPSGKSGISIVLAGTATLGGTYTANLLTPPTSAVNVTSAGTLTIAAIGVLSTTTVYAINALEEGSAGHALNPGNSPNIFPAIPTGGKSTDGKPIYIFIGEQFGGCGS